MPRIITWNIPVPDSIKPIYQVIMFPDEVLQLALVGLSGFSLLIYLGIILMLLKSII